MNWKEYCEKREPINKRLMDVKRELRNLDAAYIEEHKTFSKGDHVVIKGKKATRHAVVYGNNIGGEGRVIPMLLLMKKDRTSRPSFYHLHEFNESIVIEKCDE